jgi:DNA-binding XRE family transcriptional regulator
VRRAAAAVRDGFDVAQAECAKRVGITQTCLFPMEHGKVEIWAESLLRTSREFGKSIVA